ncbi:MAG TPA: DnaB-like helicase C-terminal domain-containing protein [Polyangiaceae bacterium]|jgi:replicative DNA helicase
MMNGIIDDAPFSCDFITENTTANDAAPPEPYSAYRERQAEQQKAAIKSPPPKLGGMILPAIARAERRAQGIEKPVPLPWSSVSAHFGGGLWSGVHYLISGTGIGKTTVALNWALYAARSGIPALYIGLELEDTQIGLRVIGEAAGIPWSALYTGQAGPALIERARDAAPGLAELPLHVELARPQGWPSTELAQRVEAMRALYPETNGSGSAPLLVVVDFLQIVGDEHDDRGRSLELRERIGRAAYRCRDCAARLGASVLVISSTARDKYGLLDDAVSKAGLVWDTDATGRPVRRRVMKPDVLVGLGKESGEIESSGDSVSVLARVPGSHDDHGGCDVLLVTAKGRATGATWSPLHFTGTSYREADDGGSFVVERLNEQADARTAERDRKSEARERAKTDRVIRDAVSVVKYVLAHDGCSVREARGACVGDASGRWRAVKDVLGASMASADGLHIDTGRLPEEVRSCIG